MPQALALLPDPPELPAALDDDPLGAARRFAANEKSEATRRAYRNDLRDFARWCDRRGLCPVPASPETVAAYLASLATGGLKTSTIGRRAAAIGYAHRLAGHEPPTNAEAVRATLRGIRRTIGTAPDRKAPATAEVVGAMLKLCPPTLLGHRDRALLALGFAGAFRRSELVALHVADLQPVPDGFRVIIRHSKTDQESQGQEIAIPRGAFIRPVEAVESWLEAAQITEGPVFRAVLKGNRVLRTPLTARVVAVIVKAYAQAAGLDPKAFAGHSLRAGFITSAAESGAALLKIADQSRHKSLDTLRGYVRSADLFRDHAGSKFL